jgi:hypothetical protein
MGKHKQLSLDTHKYKTKTTFTSTTKIVLRFSSCCIFSSSSTTPKMTPSASHGAYDTLISLRDKLTCLNGVITLEAVDKLEDELGGIFTMTKTHHYEQGQKYGHLASAIPESKYRLVIGSPTWNHTVATDPGAYSTDALAAGNAAATREQFVSQHKIEQKSYRDYLSVEEAGKELILYAVGDDAVAPLKKQYIGFGDSNDRSPTSQDGDQDDNRPKVRVQDKRVQHAVGSNDEHNRVLHAARSLPGVARGPRYRDKQSGKNNGSGRSNVAVRNVHGRSNGRMGKQDVGDADVDGAPDILHRKVAGTKAVFCHHGKAIALQGSSTPSSRGCSS